MSNYSRVSGTNVSYKSTYSNIKSNLLRFKNKPTSTVSKVPIVLGPTRMRTTGIEAVRKSA